MRQGLLFSILLTGIFCNVAFAYDWSTNLGDGSEGNPYQISTPEHLMSIGLNPNLLDKDFILINDITFDPNNNPEHVFNDSLIAPITYYNGNFYGAVFTGNFNGNGHNIFNLKINSDTEDYVGLFGYITAGKIENLGLVNVDISTNGDCVGGLAGDLYKGDINNCYVVGNVTGNTYVGGLVGVQGVTISEEPEESYISDSFSSCTVKGKSQVGGLVGYQFDHLEQSIAVITNCYSTGEVIGIGERSEIIGGLVGYLNNHRNAINHCFSTCNVQGYQLVGGLVGNIYRGNINNSYSIGNIHGVHNIGGFVGYQAYGSLVKCYSAGEVTGYDPEGMIGSAYMAFGNQGCFWDIESSGCLTSGGYGEITGLTTAEMTQLSTFVEAEWDFEPTVIDGDPADWQKPNGYYPLMTWESLREVPDVVGLSEQDALLAIQEAGYPLQVDYQYHNNVPEGYVSTQFPYGETQTSTNHLVTVQITISKGHPFIGGGEGTEESPYRITTAEDLIRIGSDSYLLDKYYVLLNNIIFDPNNNPAHILDSALIAPDLDSSEGFQGTEFTGVFNGDGHVIKNLRIEGGSNDYLGLFGCIGNESEIRNIGLENTSIAGNSYIGGFVGQNKGLVEECYSKSHITASGNYAGVFVGENQGFIRFAYSEGSVSGADYIGGFSGANSTGVIDGCYSTSHVIGNNFKGGFVGYSEEFFIYPLYGCFFDKQIAEIDTDDIATGLGTYYLQDLYTYGKWTCGENNGKWTIHNNVDYPRLNWEQKTGIPISTESIWPGQGTKENPYLIYKAGAFYAMGGFVEYILDKHFKLMNDIDLSLYDGQEGRPSINPIAGVFFLGDNPITCDFSGSFNGNFHTIRNVSINSNSHPYPSLFGTIGEYGLIENLYIDNISLVGHSCAALALSLNFEGIIRNCHANINLSYFDSGFTGGQIGGLVSGNQGLIKQCSVTGSITINGISTERAGGIVGHNDGMGSIVQCYSDVDISGPGMLGGIAAINHDTVSQCYASGSLNDYNTAGALIAESDYGGIVTDSFFLNTAGPDNGYGTPLDDPNMMIQSNFTNWDFLGESTNGENDIWRMCVDGIDYPHLSWEYAQSGDFACGDGTDIYDFQALAEHWLSTEALDPTDFSYASDANGDGVIDLLDYSVLGRNW